MKDNFSIQSDKYVRYRPTYPAPLYDFILSIVNGKHYVWDCGTGNGQVAYQLANYFEKVFATDISQSQLDNALQNEKIEYSAQPAEKTNFPDDFFDLIVVAQAIHWFDFNRFYSEVKRTLKDNGILVVIGYARLQISAELDTIIAHLYYNVVGPFWDKERRYIDENYRTIPFPFKEIEAPAFENVFDWTFEHLKGYLETWSAVKHFIRERGYNPVDHVYEELKKNWGIADTRRIKFPILLRVGKK
ncbi:MAG: class I SAM-dependent methyltransferase [Bacteroidota bacterium]|nr:class I SAM-dependent methyltransferase [Flavisolibacter sp.]MBD0284236.1 class I SAM-dependent methyltransferase [Flavisolibacter sp.]MBD0349542.1 class I SAM-dependent methyltransferase [Flavisolibacter sp.]MBD0374514.1 class I SAM-dependent methyltransferase [Flavisolibacter sp.]MDQ3843183.1 class I SAM-dependent methyltransferase [Bacteroidota bacterium]